jgi:hypothetical protein
VNWGKAFAVLLIVLQVGAAIAYAVKRDLRHSIYWFAAALINASVTF